MVDVVVNNVMSTSITPDFSKYMFNDQVSPGLCNYYWSCTDLETLNSDNQISPSIIHIAQFNGGILLVNRTAG